MTKDEFIFYVKGIIASEIEKGRVDSLKMNSPNMDVHLIGPLKLIKDALDNIQPDFVPTPGFSLTQGTTTTDTYYAYYEKCSCNPKNGGSGVCGCILGSLTTYCK
jgi:hypothetical protein